MDIKVRKMEFAVAASISAGYKLIRNDLEKRSFRDSLGSHHSQPFSNWIQFSY